MIGTEIKKEYDDIAKKTLKIIVENNLFVKLEIYV